VTDDKESIQRELQNKYVTYKTLEANLTNLNSQKEMLFSKLLEIQNTIVSIDELGKSSSDALFSLGSAAYAKGKPVDRNKVMVEIGAGVAIETPTAEAKKILEGRKKELEKSIETIQNEMNKAVAVMQRLEADVQQMLVSGQLSKGKDNEKFKVIPGGS
jgi:prefoldin alpha subunit